MRLPMNQTEGIKSADRRDEGELISVLMVAEVAAGTSELAYHSGKRVAWIRAAKHYLTIIGSGRVVHPADANVHPKYVRSG